MTGRTFGVVCGAVYNRSCLHRWKFGESARAHRIACKDRLRRHQRALDQKAEISLPILITLDYDEIEVQ